MESDYGSFLESVAADTKLPADIRAEAARLRDMWRNGVIPSPAAVDRLQQKLTRPMACARVERDGACAWVRKWGAHYGMQVPDVGERARCQFPVETRKCPGFSPA